MNKYNPIACDFYDILTLHAMHKDVVHINYSLIPEEIGFVERTGIITDIFTKDGAEYLELNDNESDIRLDQITEVNKISQSD